MYRDASTYHTGFDASMALIIAVAELPLIVFGAVDPKARLVLWGSAAFVVMLFWYLYRTTSYTFAETTLHVRCGPFHEAISYESIRRAVRSGSIMSGYAMSLKRVELEYGTYGTMLISPADRDGFLDELQRRAPHVAMGD